MNKTRALILAAGRGSRMGAVTDHSHKCLTKLANRPLLEWQLDALRGAGIEEITVVRGYRAEMLQGDFNTVENPRWAETNMVASLFCALPYDGDTIISYSDIVYKKEHVSRLIKSPADITVLADVEWAELWRKRFENPLDDAETFKSIDGKLIEIGGKTKDIREIQAQYIGLIKVSERGWDKIFEHYGQYPSARKDKIDMTSLLSDLLLQKIEINVEFVKGGWCEVDNYNDVLVYESELIKSSSWSHNWQ